jgi:hypothetical protein
MFGHDDSQQQPQDNGLFSVPEPPSAPEPPAGFQPVSPASDAPADLTTPELSANGTPDPSPASDGAGNGDDLVNLKQQALQQLSPLVGHLDQTPEEKFRTTMMLIQASDNKDLIKEAYEAAQAITDDKARAQALLDVINEINYFTQHHQN